MNSVNCFLKPALAALVLAGVSAATAQAQNSTITWSYTQWILGVSDVVNTEPYFGSWLPATANNSTVYPLNGVSFEAQSLPNFSTSLNAVTASSFSYISNPGDDANYDTLLSGGAYNNVPYNNTASVVDTVSWGGMTPGGTYQVELWASGQLSYDGDLLSETLTGGDLSAYGVDTSSPLYFTTDTGNGEFITGTFVANSSGTETIGITGATTGAGDAVSQVNMLLVEGVPEPTTMALAGLGGAALVFFRKRK